MGGQQDFEETTQSNPPFLTPADTTNSTSKALPAASVIPAWEMPKRGDRYFQIRISRNTTIAILISLLVHLLLLITLAPQLLPLSLIHI